MAGDSHLYTKPALSAILTILSILACNVLNCSRVSGSMAFSMSGCKSSSFLGRIDMTPLRKGILRWANLSGSLLYKKKPKLAYIC